VYLDTSSSNRWMRFEGLTLETVFRRALDVLGPGRLLFGSDSSFFLRGWVGQIALDQMQTLHRMGVPAAEAAMIFGGNFLTLFDKT
jgi:predicted TIM-barrel fold metal-dependent hydrolase